MSLIGDPLQEESSMKLPSRLVRSRHGVYYYRLQYQANNVRKEMRVSLRTKDVLTAKNKSFQISAIIIENRERKIGMAKSSDSNEVSTWPESAANNHDLKKLEIQHPAGVVFKDINTENDLQLFFKAVEGLKLDLPGSNPLLNVKPPSSPLKTGSETVHEIMEKYVTATSQKLSSKTKYEYGNYQKKFAEWISIYKNNNNFPMSLISMGDIADYIHDLRSLERFDTSSQKKVRVISDRTIQHKYLASLGALFEFAQTRSAYPKGEIPTRGHKVFTKKDLKNSLEKSKFKPFSDSELSHIFNPDTYLLQKTPADFWLLLNCI